MTPKQHRDNILLELLMTKQPQTFSVRPLLRVCFPDTIFLSWCFKHSLKYSFHWETDRHDRAHMFVTIDFIRDEEL